MCRQLKNKQVKMATDEVNGLQTEWDLVRVKHQDVDRVAKLMPSLYEATPMAWKDMTRSLFDDYPRISGRDQLRLMIPATRGNTVISKKLNRLLHKSFRQKAWEVDVNEFWQWMNRRFDLPRVEKIKRLETWLAKHRMMRAVNPADAILTVLWDKDLEWEDVAHEEKLRLIITKTIAKNVSYVDVEEMKEKEVTNWPEYLIKQWEKHSRGQEYVKELLRPMGDWYYSEKDEKNKRKPWVKH